MEDGVTPASRRTFWSVAKPDGDAPGATQISFGHVDPYRNLRSVIHLHKIGMVRIVLRSGQVRIVQSLGSGSIVLDSNRARKVRNIVITLGPHIVKRE